MQIWPAIDLRGGNCVRLKQGDYARETVFGDDPAAMAQHWVDLGAECLHLVDLDGARDGTPRNVESVQAMHPFYIVRAGGGLLFLIGMLIMAYNIAKTIAQGKAIQAVIPEPATAH